MLVVSAHWATTGGFTASSSPHPGVLHDFSGFPEDLYRLDYPSPGGLVHNLGRLAWDGNPDPEPWAAGFEAWMMDRLLDLDTDSLIKARELAPNHALAAPTTEHLDPLYVLLGAGGKVRPIDLFKGWQRGNLSLRALAFDNE